MTQVSAEGGWSPSDTEVFVRRGTYVAALRLQHKVLDALESSLGPEHPGTLTACAEVARWTAAARDAFAAREQYAALVAVCERVLGVEQRKRWLTGVTWRL